jgi:hypothetical protein
MSLDEKFIPVRTAFYQMVETFFRQIARLFGYPNNPGMPVIADSSPRDQFFKSLPIHHTSWPPIQRPETWLEMIFGPTPKVESLPRYFYENKEEGFYNFYIENYQNIYFLPDWLSEFIQIRLHICLEITMLETIREVLFVILMIYSQILIFRIALSWFLFINPYSVPWCYFAAAVDWTEELFQGMVPSILGVNVTASIFVTMLGRIADGLNHLVFTMPFLPSEGEETKLLMNQKVKDVLVFHYFPILWYRHPIPNEVREFWYFERPDILNYMQTAYQDLEIQFLPDQIVKELNQERLLSESISTEILSNHQEILTDVFFHHLKEWNPLVQRFLIHGWERLF